MKKILIIILPLIVIIIAVGIFVMTKGTSNLEKNNTNVNKYNLDEMDDSKLADLFYNIPKADNFVNSEIEAYRYSYKSVTNLQEAIENVKNIGKANNTETMKTELVKEADYYYAVYNEYVSHRETGDVTFKDIYLFFKESVLNTKNSTINVDIVNSKEKMKELLNIYSYMSAEENGSIKIMQPNINESTEQYEYSYYYFVASYGDFGLRDKIKLYRKIVVIDKTDGKFKISDEIIREVSGKEN